MSWLHSQTTDGLFAKSITLIILFLLINECYETGYKEIILNEDMVKIKAICNNPEFYTCDDLKQASGYCRKANLTYIEKCRNKI